MSISVTDPITKAIARAKLVCFQPFAIAKWGCVTLCVGFLPYVSSVLALPLSVFMRSYAIYFLQQFGPQYTIISEPPPGDFGFQVIMPATRGSPTIGG